MWLKVVIIILLLGLIVSLGSGLIYLFKDVGTTKRTMHSLGVRVTLAVLLMSTIVYGVMTGQLGVGAPWDARKYQDTGSAEQSAPAAKDLSAE